ncbi:MAG TPA: aldo/keto reductase, partial [Streptosporangiaceae bacterium]|nr:aldo/keto reductase [Streptosporangiaceae bacterium]
MTSGGVAGAARPRRLGALDRDVGRVGLGCVGMSAEYAPAEIDDERSRQVLGRAVQLGVRFFDTADVYGPFTTERLVGGALSGRDDVLIATK